jgi:hypothetical protein
MSISVYVAPVVVSVSGKTSVERKLSVVHNASYAASLALIGAPGKVGKAAQANVISGGIERIVKAACTSNYRPIAEYLAGMLGEAIVISNRASFESLPDQFEQRIMKIKAAKNGGYTMGKDGLEMPTAAHKLAMQLQSDCRGVIEMVHQYHDEMKARREEDNQAAIAARVATDAVMASLMTA